MQRQGLFKHTLDIVKEKQIKLKMQGGPGAHLA